MEIIADMTRQYKSVQIDMSERVSKLKKRESDNNDHINELEAKKKALEDEIKDNKNKKEQQIDGLKKRIDEMAHEFSIMLKDTLETMRDKIK